MNTSELLRVHELNLEFAATGEKDFELFLVKRIMELEAPTVLEMPLCVFCGADTWHGKGTGKRATHTTTVSDSVCKECLREFEIGLAFGDHPEIEAWHEGKASEGFNAMVETWWNEFKKGL